ncbi:FecR family protein [Pedobacter rhizosphaerae]|uniref:FecR family protein n=1 Tax=Pedobacter rhizosphaerae TaxID=390241 RepID=A0A1H9R2V6_9SPHI|nr:FecR domain-containing protein [Pedobacter rhizosphaerae]SER67028.1 FecR family protein [Pedobacter rhizosphaerae]
MKKNFFRKIAGKYVDGTVNDRQKSLIDAYFDDKQNNADLLITEEGTSSRILERINLRITSAENRGANNYRYYWAAAAIIVVVTAAIITFNLTNNPAPLVKDLLVSTKKGEKKKVILPDGSVVMLNSDSKMHYAKGFSGPLRKVDLEGEAYFDVVHNPKRPFIVHSKAMDIKVLGTLFNIKAYEGEKTEASLIRGAVQVFLPDAKKALVTLKPNEKFILGSGIPITSSKQLVAKGKGFIVTTPKQIIANSEIKSVAWVHNRLSFDDQGFKEVAALLERWYDVTITIDNPELLKYRFTGTFNDTGLIDVLDALKASEDFKYRKEGDKIHIY